MCKTRHIHPDRHRAQPLQIAAGIQFQESRGSDNSSGDSTLPAFDNPGEITGLLHAWQGGSDDARDGLWSVLYSELRAIARGLLHRTGRGGRGDDNSLVHKAYLRLILSEVDWRDRRHFFAVAARAMRFVLTDEARRQLAKKRGQGETVPLDTSSQAAGPPARPPEEVLSIHQLLNELAEIHPRYGRLVELRYFAGLSVEETAKVLDVTPRTVVRDWKTTRLWLLGQLKATT